MFVLHLNIDGVNNRTVRQCNSIRIRVNDIPAAFFTIRWYMAIRHILKNPLVKITDVIVVGFVALTENLVADCLFPRCAIYSLIENKFDRIDDVAVKPFEIKRFQLVTVFLNGCPNMVCKLLFRDK